MNMWHEETLKIIQRGTDAGEFTPKDDVASIAWRSLPSSAVWMGFMRLG
jgi:hypothetical protein